MKKVIGIETFSVKYSRSLKNYLRDAIKRVDNDEVNTYNLVS